MPPRTRATASPPSITAALASIAPGAMPTCRPPAARPTMVAAVWVPCSSLSFGFGGGVTSRPIRSNSAKCATAPWSVGCSPSTPVSSCPTSTPFPVSPRSHSAGAPSRSRPQVYAEASFAARTARGRIGLSAGAPTTCTTSGSARSAASPSWSTVPSMMPSCGKKRYASLGSPRLVASASDEPPLRKRGPSRVPSRFEAAAPRPLAARRITITRTCPRDSSSWLKKRLMVSIRGRV